MIRPATEADLQAILDIYNDAVINTTAVYTYTPHTLDMRRQWFNEHREAGLPVFVLEEDGVVAGFATYGNFRPWPAYKYSIEHSNNLTNLVGRRVWGFTGIKPVLRLPLRTADGWQRDYSDDNSFI